MSDDFGPAGGHAIEPRPDRGPPSLVAPFAGLRPPERQAADVLAPPYDVVSSAEARALVTGRPWSFLRISRPEVDLPEDCDPQSDAAYAKATENFERMLRLGKLVRDELPQYYVYRLTVDSHEQTGLVAAASLAAYARGRIKKHELTRPAKEDDRARQIDALDAQTGPVLLAHRADPRLRELLAQACVNGPPDLDVTAYDGVRHRLWAIADRQAIGTLSETAEALPALYIADGHHRAAAAGLVAAKRGSPAHERFLAVLFPHDELQVLPYHRVIRDLNGLDTDGLLVRIGERFDVGPVDSPVQPEASTQFGLYCDRRWWQLALRDTFLPRSGDPVDRLAVSLLHRHLVEPVLGISDPRRDPRIDFVGGSRGLAGLMAQGDNGDMRLALSLPPTGIDELLAVADAGAMMPPKSTWFEPKLADGLVSLLLD